MQMRVFFEGKFVISEMVTIVMLEALSEKVTDFMFSVSFEFN